MNPTHVYIIDYFHMDRVFITLNLESAMAQFEQLVAKHPELVRLDSMSAGTVEGITIQPKIVVGEWQLDAPRTVDAILSKRIG